MPQLTAAKKALRVSARKRIQNDWWRDRLRHGIRSLKNTITAGQKKEAAALLLEVQSLLDRSARRHIIHPNKAAHQKAQFTRLVDQLP